MVYLVIADRRKKYFSVKVIHNGVIETYFVNDIYTDQCYCFRAYKNRISFITNIEPRLLTLNVVAGVTETVLAFSKKNEVEIKEAIKYI